MLTWWRSLRLNSLSTVPLLLYKIPSSSEFPDIKLFWFYVPFSLLVSVHLSVSLWKFPSCWFMLLTLPLLKLLVNFPMVSLFNLLILRIFPCEPLKCLPKSSFTLSQWTLLAALSACFQFSHNRFPKCESVLIDHALQNSPFAQSEADCSEQTHSNTPPSPLVAKEWVCDPASTEEEARQMYHRL